MASPIARSTYPPVLPSSSSSLFRAPLPLAAGRGCCVEAAGTAETADDADAQCSAALPAAFALLDSRSISRTRRLKVYGNNRVHAEASRDEVL